MVGIRMIVIMAIVGGLIAYIADNMGSKIGKKRMSVFGLRPRHTSILLTVLSGMMISVLTIGVMAISSESARTALFGMEKIKAEVKMLEKEKSIAQDALAKAKVEVEEKNSIISTCTFNGSFNVFFLICWNNITRRRRNKLRSCCWCIS